MNSTPVDPIQAQIEAARLGAAALANAPVPTNVPAQATQAPGGQVVNYVPAPSMPMSMSMEDAVTNHFAPTKWLKISKDGDGLRIGDGPLLDNLDVVIVPSECKLAQAVKYGNPAVYLKSYDGVTTVQGDNFAAKIQEAYRIDPQCKGVYKTVDIPMRVTEVVTSPKKGDDTILATPEDIIGHSLSTTNFGEWSHFYKRIMALGLVDQEVNVRLGVKKRVGKHVWGILTFTLLDDAAQAA